MSEHDALIPLAEVCRQAGLCRASIYLLIKAGTFPKQAHVGRSSRWSQAEVQAWIAETLASRERRAS